MMAGARIVFLGDSITDGHTYLLLIQQALREAGQSVPTCINAGIISDTAKGMRARLDRDVFVHRPTLMTLSVGINDCRGNVSLADYQADVTAIADRLQSEQIPLLILTTSVLGEAEVAAQPRQREYNLFLRDLARQRGCGLADVHQLMEGVSGILDGDDVHPNFAGQRLIARAVLDALGQSGVAVPEKLHLELLPGVICEWQIRSLPDGQWQDYRLPEIEPQTGWYEQERPRGFALSLEKVCGPAKSYQGRATLTVATARSVYFNTGAGLQSVALNGVEIYRSTGWTGWHAGRERIAAQLRPGANEILVEMGGAFFLSVTDSNDW